MTTHKHTPTDWQTQYNTFIESGIVKATRRAYTRVVNYFWHWVQTHLYQPITYPATLDMCLPFCLYHLAPDSPHPLKVSTLKRYLASLSIAHQDKGVISPTTHPKLKLLLKQLIAPAITI